MRDTLYATIYPIPSNMPVDPGVTSQVPPQATTVVCLKLLDEHLEDCRIHNNHQNMDAALKTMVLKAVDITYIFALHNVITGCMG